MLSVVVDDHDMGVTHIIRGDDHLNNAAASTSRFTTRSAGPVPRYGAYPADPRRRRREAVEAPWRARRRRLSRHGLSAGSAAQLPRPPRLEPWRRRVFTYDPGFTSTAPAKRDHLYRRRRGRPAASRLSDRAAGRARRLPRGLLPAAATANCRPPAQKASRFRQPRHRHTMVHEQMHRFFRASAATRTRWRSWCGVVGALSAFYHDSTDINDPTSAMIASPSA
jgi:hypothetical protein